MFHMGVEGRGYVESGIGIKGYLEKELLSGIKTLGLNPVIVG